MGVALVGAWVAVAVCAGLTYRQYRKNRDAVTDAFGLGITVGREFKKMQEDE